MTRTKKTWLVLGIAVFSVALALFAISRLAPKPTLHGDYPYYSDVKSLVEDADVVVVGEVITARDVQYLMIDRTANKAEKEAIPYTLSTVKITEVIKGELVEGEVITIKQIGDFKNMPDDFLNETNGYLTKGTTQLMFLKGYEESPYSPLSPQQGIIEIKDGVLYSNSKYSLFGYSENEKSTRETWRQAAEEIRSYVP